MLYIVNETGPLALSARVLREMRGWLEDCGYHAVGRSDREVARLVEQHYCGGVAEFIRSEEPAPAREPSMLDPNNDPSWGIGGGA